jgi:hypothetical protein
LKILCPSCRRELPAENLNIATDLGKCTACGEVFQISSVAGQRPFEPESLRNPPSGTWFRQHSRGFVLGASTRSPFALFIIPFGLVWSGGSLGGIYGTQLVQGQFNPFMSLFGIPFLIGSVMLWATALMSVAGRVELRVEADSGVHFVGIGPIGIRKRFRWSEITGIREGINTSLTAGNRGRSAIVLEGSTRLLVGGELNESRRYYFLNVLKSLQGRRF